MKHVGLYSENISFISSILVSVILLSSRVIEESMSFIDGLSSLCVFKLLGLRSILGSVMTISFHYIFLSISIFSF